MPPAKAKGARFEHGSVLGGKTRAARVNSQWKSTSNANDGRAAQNSGHHRATVEFVHLRLSPNIELGGAIT
jgi:hypothetical protein